MNRDARYSAFSWERINENPSVIFFHNFALTNALARIDSNWTRRNSLDTVSKYPINSNPELKVFLFDYYIL